MRGWLFGVFALALVLCAGPVRGDGKHVGNADTSSNESDSNSNSSANSKSTPGAIYLGGPSSDSSSSSGTSGDASGFDPNKSAAENYNSITSGILDSLKSMGPSDGKTPAPSVKVEMPKIEIPTPKVESVVTEPAKSKTVGAQGEPLGDSRLTVDNGKIFRTGTDGKTKDFKLVELTVTDKNGKTIPPGTLTTQQVNKILGDGGKIGYPDGSC